MNRSLLAAIAALAAFAPSASAAGPAVIADPRGDWPVAASDVLSVRVDGVVKGTAHTLRAQLTLAAAPDAVTEYQVALSNQCDSWTFATRGYGTAAQTATLTHHACGDSPTSRGASVPATVTVKGTVVEFTAPYAVGLRRGTKVTYLAAAASVYYVSAGVGTDPSAWATDGDLALGNATYSFR